MKTFSLIGKGIYSVPEAARIIHVDPRSVRHWISGCTAQHSHRFSPPILVSEIASLEGMEMLTFQQLVEVMFVKLFREHQVSMPTIRAAAMKASQKYCTPHPFALEGLRTDGTDIFHLTEEDVIKAAGEEASISQRQFARDLKNGQAVLLEFAEPYFRKIDYGSLEAMRYWPLGKEKSVVLDPQRSFGQPIIAASRVPTRTLYSMYRGSKRQPGEAIQTISKWFEVPEAAVQDAVAFEESLLPKAA